MQGLRAVAVLAVVAFHAGLPLSGGFAGVDVFFVISGFVISGALMRELSRSGRISFATFYRRRLRRLIPAAAVVSVVTLLGSLLFLSPVTGQQVSAEAALASSLFVSNIYFAVSSGGYFSPVVEGNPFLHTWSLSVEEQFYLVFPLLLLVVLKLSRRRSREAKEWHYAIVVAALAVVSFALCVWLTHGPFPSGSGLWAKLEDYSDRLAFYSPVTRAWEFGLGVLVQLWERHRKAIDAVHLGPAASRASELLGWALLLGGIVLLTEHEFPGWKALVPALGTALVIHAYGRRHGGLGERLLSARPLTWIGDRSYSWYLWHWPAVVFAGAVAPGSVPAKVVASLLALGLAAGSYRWVEEPVRRAPDGARIGRPLTIVTAGIVVPVALAGGLLAGARAAWGQPVYQAMRAQLAEEHLDRTSGCFGAAPVGDPSRARCTWPVEGSRGTVLFIGDSHAGHLSEAAVSAINSLGYTAEVATFGSCPLVQRPDQLSQACSNWVDRSLQFITAHPGRYAAIVTSSSSVGYVAKSVGAGDYDPPERLRAAAATWAGQSATTAAALQAVAPTLVLLDVPGAPDFTTCIAPGPLAHHDPSCGQYSPTSPIVVRRDLVVGLEKQALAAKGVATFDPRPLICDATGCSAWLAPDVLRYFDASHLTIEAGKPLAEPIATALGRVLTAGSTP